MQTPIAQGKVVRGSESDEQVSPEKKPPDNSKQPPEPEEKKERDPGPRPQQTKTKITQRETPERVLDDKKSKTHRE